MATKQKRLTTCPACGETQFAMHGYSDTVGRLEAGSSLDDFQNDYVFCVYCRSVWQLGYLMSKEVQDGIIRSDQVCDAPAGHC